MRNGRIQAQLIEDLLDVSRIVANKLHIELGRFDLAAVAQAAADTVRPAALERGVELDLVLESMPCEMVGDAGRLQQVVWNLLSNAVKFTGAGGRVVLRVARTRELAEAQVIDQGMGIAPEFLPHVFDRFRQGESSMVRSAGGLGLGLAIAHSIVSLHRGTIAAASDGEGHGATFTVRLPVGGPDGGELDVSALGSITGSLRLIVGGATRLDGVRVLLVDDERDALDLHAEFLRQAGADVTEARSVTAALASMGEATFDVLVSDLTMPNEDGYALMRALDERAARLPAIALSAHATLGDRDRALAAGFRFHMTKPVAENALIEHIRQLARPH
jgi:CheY-like chemotaxis protein